MSSEKSTVSRRNFLQGTAGIGAAAAALAALKSGSAQAAEVAEWDTRPFKLGIVGCGWQGKVLMREAIKNPGMEFTAVCDIVPERRKEALEITGGKAKEFTDYKEMLKSGLFQGVLVATPLHMHHPIVMEALSADIDVFCEKCLAYNIDQCKEMAKTALTKGKILQVGHHLRYHPSYWLAKLKFVETNMLGKVRNIHVQWNRNSSWRKPAGPADVAFAQWGYEKPDHLWNWRLYKQYSGGVMTELVSHQLDVVNWFLGDAFPEAINGVGRIDWEDDRTIFDNVHLIYEYPDNVQVTCTGFTKNAYNPFGWEAYEMIQGEKGTLVMTHLAPKYNGLFFIEPGVPEAIWMPLATRANFDNGNLRKDQYKNPIVMGHPTPKKDNIAGIDLAALLGEDNLPTASTYQLEMHDFRKSVLDRTQPFCHGLIGLKSAIPALLGNVAMEKQERLVVPKDIANLA